jgi:hypothetical protein
MSLDVGLIVRKHKKGYSFYEVCLSTRQRNFIETIPLKDNVEKKTKELDNKIASECGAYYEAIFQENGVKDSGKTNKEIKRIKAETAKEMKAILKKTIRHGKTVARVTKNDSVLFTNK